MSADPSNDFRPGDNKTNILRKILLRIQFVGLGSATPVNPSPGDVFTVLERKILTQLATN